RRTAGAGAVGGGAAGGKTTRRPERRTRRTVARVVPRPGAAVEGRRLGGAARRTAGRTGDLAGGRGGARPTPGPAGGGGPRFRRGAAGPSTGGAGLPRRRARRRHGLRLPLQSRSSFVLDRFQPVAGALRQRPLRPARLGGQPGELPG